MLHQVVTRAQSIARAVSSSSRDDTVCVEEGTRHEAAVAKRQLAALQGELEGATCKLNGFQHALEEMEAQLTHKDLKVAMLKSVIEDEDSSSLRRRLLKATEESQDLQSRLQAADRELSTARQEQIQLRLKCAAREPTSTDQDILALPSDNGVFVTVSTASPNKQSKAAGLVSLEQHAVQLVLLRKALTQANMRLRSLSAPPVSVQDVLYMSGGLDVLDQGSQGPTYLSMTPSRASSLSLPSDINFSPNGTPSGAPSPFSSFQLPCIAAGTAAGDVSRTNLLLCSTRSAEGSVEGPATPPSPSKACAASGAARALVLDAAGAQRRLASCSSSAVSVSSASAEHATTPTQGGSASVSCSALELESPCGDGGGSFAGHAAYEGERRRTTCVNPLFRTTGALGHANPDGTASGPCSPTESTDSALPRRSTGGNFVHSPTMSPTAVPLRPAFSSSHARLLATGLPGSVQRLEGQLLAARQALAALAAPAAAAQGEAGAAHARLRRSVKLLTHLYEQLKELLEEAGQEQRDDNKQALQPRLAHAIEDLASLAKHTREMGSHINAVRRLVAHIEAECGGSGDGNKSAGGKSSTTSASGSGLYSDGGLSGSGVSNGSTAAAVSMLARIEDDAMEA